MIELAIEQAKRQTDELLPTLDRGPGARELAITKTKLEEAEMWLRASRERFEASEPTEP